MRSLSFLVLALLAGCDQVLPFSSSPVETSPSFCQAGLDGEPPGPQADRGIGGTGISGEEGEDRGIGGTGISGTVTGFASICVNGLEVRYDTAGSGLHVGDQVLIDATGHGEQLEARHVSVRHEVSGPVESVGADGLLQVAGQLVQVSRAIGATPLPGPGDWVEMSGLRRPDDTILATRISRRAPGAVLVHGTAVVQEGQWRVAALRLQAEPKLPMPTGPVSLRGTYAGGTLQVERAEPDLLRANPALRFATARRLVLEAYVSTQNGQLALGTLHASIAAGLLLPSPSSGPAVVDLRRQPEGGFIAVDLHHSGNGEGAFGRMALGSPFGAPPPSHPGSLGARQGHVPPDGQSAALGPRNRGAPAPGRSRQGGGGDPGHPESGSGGPGSPGGEPG